MSRPIAPKESPVATDTLVTQRAPSAARRMAEAANRFLASLSPQQRERATFPFVGDERYLWHYTPVERNGLILADMTPGQRELALALMDTGLSARGVREARRIIALEPILREEETIEQRPTPWLRDSERYWFSIFGEPGGRDPWAWRAGGHHIGLHFTLVDGDLIAPLPQFFGANPATVKHGPEKGSRTLAAEEDLARELVQSLDADQRAVAIVNQTAPADLLTTNIRSVSPDMTPVGLGLSKLGGGQRDLLVRLIRHYVERAADDLSPNEWARIERAGLDRITFAWAGPTEKAPGNGHYYNVKGPTFMLEYDNTQQDANHIHSVWRDFTNDWGEDLLARHYRESSHHH
ncbi:MAG: DUF3500 domain-containing protein [Chloroflexi bacterium]|nr:DUF3500 domain-containing protein [Chloroflexota bacterium]